MLTTKVPTSPDAAVGVPKPSQRQLEVLSTATKATSPPDRTSVQPLAASSRLIASFKHPSQNGSLKLRPRVRLHVAEIHGMVVINCHMISKDYRAEHRHKYRD